VAKKNGSEFIHVNYCDLNITKRSNYEVPKRCFSIVLGLVCVSGSTESGQNTKCRSVLTERNRIAIRTMNLKQLATEILNLGWVFNSICVEYNFSWNCDLRVKRNTIRIIIIPHFSFFFWRNMTINFQEIWSSSFYGTMCGSWEILFSEILSITNIGFLTTAKGCLFCSKMWLRQVVHKCDQDSLIFFFVNLST
jgi:hypothetical protein